MTGKDTKFQSWLIVELVITGLLICYLIWFGVGYLEDISTEFKIAYFVGLGLGALRFYTIFDLMQGINESLKESVGKGKGSLLSNLAAGRKVLGKVNRLGADEDQGTRKKSRFPRWLKIIVIGIVLLYIILNIADLLL